MTRTEWLKERQSGIGGTDAAAIAGVGFVDAAQVYAEKVAPDPLEREPTMRMRLGLELEGFVRREYEAATGRTVEIPDDPFVRHPEQRWRGCSPDGFSYTDGDGRVLETKCVFGPPNDSWGEPGTDEIPDGYLVQVQHNLDVCLAAEEVVELVADVAVLFVGYELRVYRVRRNYALIRPLVDLQRAFWDHVELRVPVDLDWHHPLRDTIAERLASIHPDTSVALDPDAVALVHEIDRLTLVKKYGEGAEDDIRRLKSRLAALMGEAETGLVPDGRRVKRYFHAAKTITPSPYLREARNDIRILNPKKGRQSDE